MQLVNSQTIEATLDFASLISALREGFKDEIFVPQRMHLDYASEADHTNTLLLMPAIQLGRWGGVKLINVAPGNVHNELATIQGVYYLMDAITGAPCAIFDAKSMTNWRTAAASALASSFLSRQDATKLCVLGTGALAPYIVRAHASVRSIEHVMVYGRTRARAEETVAQLAEEFSRVEVIDSIEGGIAQADIITSVTSSPSPLIHGRYLKPGQHVDLVGAYTPKTRESDDEVMRVGRVYVDNLAAALHEAGDLLIPLETKVITANDVIGDLFQLCRSEVSGRSSEDEITVFKSVGHAMEDLATAILLYNQLFTS